MISRAKIALLHVAKAQLGWSDDLYREILRHHAGVDSSRDLDDAGFKRVLDHAKALGFWVRREWHPTRMRDARELPTPDQLKVIEHLRLDLAEYLPEILQSPFWRGFLVKRLGCPAIGPQTRAQANRVIETLKQRVDRAMRARRKINPIEA